MITNIQENIIPYIGETTPFFSIPENLKFNGHILETEILDFDFQNKNFPEHCKVFSSLGSCNLYRILNDTSLKKIYFLGETIRFRKLSHKTSSSVFVTCESSLESEMKGKSVILIKDIHSREMLYSFEINHYIIAEEAFKHFYKNFYHDDSITAYDKNLPESRISEIKSENRFNISIKPFTPEQCKGHFENYPLVPFAFIGDRILKEIFTFLGDKYTYEIESMDGYASNAIPTDKEIVIEVFHQKFLKDLFYFKSEIKDASGTSYGTLIFNIKSKIKE